MTRTNLSFGLALTALSLVTLAPATRAQTFITTNTTLDASNPVAADANIGYGNATDLGNQPHRQSGRGRQHRRGYLHLQ